MVRTKLPPMADIDRCSSCGIRRWNHLTPVIKVDDVLVCMKCIQEAARGAVMAEDPEYLRPPNVPRDSLTASR